MSDDQGRGAHGRGRKPKADSWSALGKRLRRWEAPELLGLLHELHTRMPETRAVMAARVFPERPVTEGLEPYRKRIRKAIRPGKWKEPHVAAAKQAIRQYRRASDDDAGAVDLMVEYLEVCLWVVNEQGDLGGPFYDSMYATVGEIGRIVERAGPEVRERIRAVALERVRRMEKSADVGYGMDSEIGGLVGFLEREVGEGSGESDREKGMREEA